MAFIPYPPLERPPEDQMDQKTREFWQQADEIRDRACASFFAWFVVPDVLLWAVPLLLLFLLKLLT